MVHAWVLLSECLLKLHIYNEAMIAATQAKKILQSVKKEILEKKLNKILICTLSRCTNEEKWKEAIDLSKEVYICENYVCKVIIISNYSIPTFSQFNVNI